MKTIFRFFIPVFLVFSFAFVLKQTEGPKAGPNVCAFALKRFIEIRKYEKDYMLLKKNEWTEGLPAKIGNVRIEILTGPELQGRAAATEILGYYSLRQEEPGKVFFTINVVNHFLTPDEDVESCGIKMQIACDGKQKKTKEKGSEEWCN